MIPKRYIGESRALFELYKRNLVRESMLMSLAQIS